MSARLLFEINGQTWEAWVTRKRRGAKTRMVRARPIFVIPTLAFVTLGEAPLEVRTPAALKRWLIGDRDRILELAAEHLRSPA